MMTKVASGRSASRTGGESFFERFDFSVHADSERLEETRLFGMAGPAAEHRLEDGHEVVAGPQGAGGAAPGDARGEGCRAGRLSRPERRQQLGPGRRREESGRGELLPRIHPHVEGGPAAHGEPALVGVQLVGAHAEIQQRPRQPLGADLRVLARVAEGDVREADPVPEGSQARARRRQGLPVAVHRQEAALRTARQQRGAVPPTTDRAVEVEPRLAQKVHHDLVHQDSAMVCGAVHRVPP